MKKIIPAVIVLLVVIVVGAGAFFAGTAYGQTQAQDTRAEFFRNRQGGAGQGATGQGGAPGQFGQNGQGRPAAFGTVKSVNGNTITLTMQDGSTVNVTVNNQTAIQKTTTGTLSDIQPGERITFESAQTGSNITASGIQIRPAQQQQQ